MQTTPLSIEGKTRGHGAGPDGVMHLQKLLNALQDAAEDHATALGVGMDVLEPRGLAWVLVQLRLEFFRLPCCGETYTVRTWPSGANRLYAWRQYQVLAGGGLLARGASAWIVADLKKRKAARMPQEVQDIVPPDAPEAGVLELGEDPSKLSLPDAELPGLAFPIRLADLDRNGHVNNAVICQWLYEGAIPVVQGPLAGRPALVSFEVRFRNEITPGQRPVSVCSQPERLENGLLSCGNVVRCGEEISAAARTLWRMDGRAAPDG